jgi:alcohol dehydrogenase, propanol-preferring
MTDIPSFPYVDLWEERVVTSVANMSRRDGEEFFEIAPRVPVRAHTETFLLTQANSALDLFRAGKLSATAVLTNAE